LNHQREILEKYTHARARAHAHTHTHTHPPLFSISSDLKIIIADAARQSTARVHVWHTFGKVCDPFPSLSFSLSISISISISISTRQRKATPLRLHGRFSVYRESPFIVSTRIQRYSVPRVSQRHASTAGLSIIERANAQMLERLLLIYLALNIRARSGRIPPNAEGIPFHALL